jgi:hypothetical protein
VNSRANRSFWDCLERLPIEVRDYARESYRIFRQDPHHPSLQFKPVHQTKPIYSARVTRDFRALGILRGDTIVWFWIGKHADYERLLSRR